MSSELEKLRELMDESVYKKKRFTDKEMKELFRNVRSKEKRNLWIPQTLTVIFTSAFLGVGCLYLHDYLVDGDAIGWQQTAGERWEDADSSLPEGTSISPVWKNIHASELKVPDFIGLVYLEDEEFLSDFRGPVRFPKSNGEDTFMRYRYTSGADSSAHLIIEQWHTSSGSPAWLEEQMQQPETKEIVKANDTTFYLQNDGDKNIGFFSKGKLAFFVSGNADIITLVEVQRILEKITEGIDFSKMIEYEGRPK
ncbi:hypothetical protein [Paenisporosarcina indica]|uniref:hypothetical protein n=1 Tax=Paenisporosarcina indica TaxID=650093 RepID=UPI0009500F40|nr:hypothetical protein [Paenisporosarcina indica]